MLNPTYGLFRPAVCPQPFKVAQTLLGSYPHDALWAQSADTNFTVTWNHHCPNLAITFTDKLHVTAALMPDGESLFPVYV